MFFPDRKARFIRLRNLAAPHVGEQIHHALTQTFALAFDKRLLRIRIQREVVARRCCRRPLLHGETNALARFRIALHGVREFLQITRVEQIPHHRERERGRALPGGIREAAVFQRRKIDLLLARLLEQLGGIARIIALQLMQTLRGNRRRRDFRQGRQALHRRAKAGHAARELREFRQAVHLREIGHLRHGAEIRERIRRAAQTGPQIRKRIRESVQARAETRKCGNRIAGRLFSIRFIRLKIRIWCELSPLRGIGDRAPRDRAPRVEPLIERLLYACRIG